jgi:glyoxylase-like metal-dependent hydrolase (beta-lactamase superfamily II)
MPRVATLLGPGIALAWGLVALAQAPGPGDFPRITRLADDVYAYEQMDPTKRGVTANNLIVITTEGVLVADGQGTVENTRRLVADIAGLTPQPIRYVVVGSIHGDHRGGDAAFPPAATFLKDTANRVLTMGGREIDVLFLGRAHTGSDLEVYLPREKILYMSEVFSNRIFPSMANGYPTEWVAVLDRAERMDVAAFVPAHGLPEFPVLLPGAERSFHAAIERVIAEGRRLHDAKVPVEDAAARADFGDFAGWWRRTENVSAALKRVYMELDGELGAAPGR